MTALAPRTWREDRPPIVVRGHVGGKCVGPTRGARGRGVHRCRFLHSPSGLPAKHSLRSRRPRLQNLTKGREVAQRFEVVLGVEGVGTSVSLSQRLTNECDGAFPVSFHRRDPCGPQPRATEGVRPWVGNESRSNAVRLRGPPKSRRQYAERPARLSVVLESSANSAAYSTRASAQRSSSASTRARLRRWARLACSSAAATRTTAPRAETRRARARRGHVREARGRTPTGSRRACSPPTFRW